MPRAPRIDGDHPLAKREGLGPIIADDFQARGTVEDINQLLAGKMSFPMTLPGEFGDEQTAVAVGRQSGAAGLAIRYRRLRRPPAERRQLCELGVEIDDAGRSGCYYFLLLCRPPVVHI